MKYKSDEKFLKQVILRLKKENWTINDINYLYDKFLDFIKKENLDELSLLRYGEVLSGKALDCIDYNNIDNIRLNIFNLLDNIDKLNIPIIVNVIAAILKLTILNYKKEEK